jgi:hypothetical protein
MQSRVLLTAAVALLAASIISAFGLARAEAPDIAGSYRCEPQPMPCKWGTTFSVAPAGNKLELKSEKGELLHAQFTSPITISAEPPWNSLGVIYGRTIEWSDGTKWQKL